ncbi:hypothetical protein ACO22_06915 [Paracoccidioides brasiliensis]|uniref:Uncharacterized protein n=1 Tax=Paracoccidioides brasiliensis TaxID=121759 RepID=A0A1D2J670_PARBR|nr:hypothetical protein ACO22_06915 [Paracoccidioides brasiliensis]
MSPLARSPYFATLLKFHSSPVKMARNIQALRHGLDPSQAGYEAQLTYKHSAGYFHPSKLRSISLHNFPVSGLHSTK